MSTFPGDMAPEEFFTLPVNDGEPRVQDLRSAHHPTGFVDDEGTAWVWCLMDDGTYARQRLGLW